MKKMYLIQRFDSNDEKLSDAKGFSRIIDGDYMGSAEFEFGAVQRAYKFFRSAPTQLYEHEAQSIGGKAALVKFYVVTTPEGFEKFKADINNHLDGKTASRQTKEYSGIWEKFNTTRTVFSSPDLWMDISQSGYYNNPIPEGDEPIVFSDDYQLALRFFMESKLGREEVVFTDHRISDLVYTYLKDTPAKICGLNSDDSISIKYPHGKAIKMHPRDIWTPEALFERVDPEHSIFKQ